MTPTAHRSAEGLDPEAVRDVLREATGADPGPVELDPMGGGASRQLWTVSGSEGPSWVLRRDPPGSTSYVSMETEYRVMAQAGRAGVPVPEPLAFEPEGGRFGSAGFLMQRLQGEGLGPRILKRPELERARERLVSQLGAALAKIHATEPPPGLLENPSRDPAEAQVSAWEAELDALEVALPAVEAGLRWLRLNLPEPAEPTLVHGDFRLGNFLVDPNGLVAVLDWELCHTGDPAEDVGWLCIRSWRFGNDDERAAGLGSLEELLAAYREAGGGELDPERLRFWEVFGNVKWAIICAAQAADHMSGERRSMELAALGRRICEPEWDLLELISSASEGVR